MSESSTEGVNLSGGPKGWELQLDSTPENLVKGECRRGKAEVSANLSGKRTEVLLSRVRMGVFRANGETLWLCTE